MYSIHRPSIKNIFQSYNGRIQTCTLYTDRVLKISFNPIMVGFKQGIAVYESIGFSFNPINRISIIDQGHVLQLFNLEQDYFLLY
jgi:hypothetical protein